MIELPKKLRVAVLGATGMVGQRFLALLEHHPWFDVTLVAASGRSAGLSYAEAVHDRWALPSPLPPSFASLPVADASSVSQIADEVDFVFCAVDMPKDAIARLEEAYAKAETPVISNTSAHRTTPDVPMIIPEVNPEHANVIPDQRKRLGTTRGFIAVKPNCSVQSYVPAIHPLMDFRPRHVVVSTYQAISGAGKTFESWPEMQDNVIPFIAGEEEKSEQEPRKIWGRLAHGVIVPSAQPVISAQCIRIPVTDGHLATVFVAFEKRPCREEILARWRNGTSLPQRLGLPTAPCPWLTYFEQDARPQTRLDRDLGKGMGISVGRLRTDSIFDIRFVALSHNTVRGAAGGAVLTAEWLTHEGYITAK
ncbi:MAG TPA: aspartate-semialdehyde dehydrogenase [Polyangiaceae bacterium]|jgi:aspartate-semialdehyde dehydrogenase|nr:MAG: Aspartate-semialdehyde dehydrogenase [Deltaproteobacteria bacterium ADurb.Bin207]HNS95453.1 aspartate-semialdehyde dehydrogenase [Polyangiaceae bacterium]HNZ20607.1 aspartate-semialdehyde dehydrogenase [Polyangiaceae bacterium]HOD20777.1 aspartate-semialdehyde dehydrogenase [Polyangiaceae bacterium]HOE47197.1 aspartate-semialdehyde dehydrogenase [Polyangiaceae bacterium]